ncbi:hypothetical protein Tco_0571169 [Tanacetum coccineum]
MCTKFVAYEIREGLTKYISGFPDYIYELLSIPKPIKLERTMSWPMDLMDLENINYLCGNSRLTNKKEGMMIHLETTMDITNKSSRGRLSPRYPSKKEEDKSDGKQLKGVPIVQDFPEVFPEDLPGLPPA